MTTIVIAQLTSWLANRAPPLHSSPESTFARKLMNEPPPASTRALCAMCRSRQKKRTYRYQHSPL